MDTNINNNLEEKEELNHKALGYVVELNIFNNH